MEVPFPPLYPILRSHLSLRYPDDTKSHTRNEGCYRRASPVNRCSRTRNQPRRPHELPGYFEGIRTHLQDIIENFPVAKFWLDNGHHIREGSFYPVMDRVKDHNFNPCQGGSFFDCHYHSHNQVRGNQTGSRFCLQALCTRKKLGITIGLLFKISRASDRKSRSVQHMCVDHGGGDIRVSQ